MPPSSRPRLKYPIRMKVKDHKYPLLMKSSYSGCIVLMTAWGKGKVVGTGNTCIHDLKINQELVGLNMSVFHPITEENI